jgi:hypothetical protein
VFEEVIESNRRGTWTINAVTVHVDSKFPITRAYQELQLTAGQIRSDVKFRVPTIRLETLRFPKHVRRHLGPCFESGSEHVNFRAEFR